MPRATGARAKRKDASATGAGTAAPRRGPLSRNERDALLTVLRERFSKHPGRHKGIDWADVQARLLAKPAKLSSLAEMERTGGEPDVIRRDDETGAYVFVDCSAQSPSGRRSLCYDREARESRTVAPPASSALEMAPAMGIDLLTQDEYRGLQSLGEFDTTTSSWVRTPPEVRKRGGAMFGDRRYGVVWFYHNGAESYYAARGFRGALRV